MRTRTMTALTAALLILSGMAYGSDWPQWRGPDRNDVSKETGLLKTWPEGGPKLLWTFEEAGVGYAGMAVVGDILYTMGADSKNEYVYALDLKTQKKAWNTEIGSLYNNGYGDGPRGTPTVDGNLIFCLSGRGNLVCVDKSSGEKKWNVSLTSKELGGSVPGWGYCESPLVDGDFVIVSPGGSKGCMIALNKNTGAEVWHSKDLKDSAGYSSAIVAEVQGVRQYIRTTMQGVAGVEAKTGNLLWYFPVKEFRTAVIPTPIYKDGFVFNAAGYGVGGRLIKLTKDGDKFKAEKAFSSSDMDNKHGGVVLVGDNLFGFTDKAEKRENGGSWICENFKTGEVLAAKKFPKGSVTCAGDHLYCYAESNGTCTLVEANPGMKECGKFKIPKATKLPRKSGGIWTHPVVANGKLFLRDEDLIFCYDVSDSK